MKLMRAITLLGVCVAALALAANGAQGSKGRGVLQNENDLRATFNYQIHKVVRGDRMDVRGDFHFKAGDRRNQRAIEIDMANAKGLNVQNRTAEFGGPAKAVFITNQGRVVREGTLRVHVEDVTSPEHPTDRKDVLRLRFEAPRVNVTFEYGGRVAEGDLVVFERNGD